MVDRVVLGVAICNGRNADRRLETFAKAIRLGTLCSKVSRLFTVVTDASSICLRDGGPSGRRGANQCERSFRRRPLVLLRVSDFDRRWAGHIELQAQIVGAVPVHLGGSTRLL